MSTTKFPSRISVSHLDTPQAAFHFDFSDGPHAPNRIGCEFLSGEQDLESWLLLDAERYRFVVIDIAEADLGIEQAAAKAYRDLLEQVRPSKHPYLLRIWNYFSAINQGQGDKERYRGFCVGRSQSVDGQFNTPPPAATAIGTNSVDDKSGFHLQLIALSSSQVARTLENPRQTPAWRYPREYGPVPPGFSRGIILDEDTETPRLLASGTASIVGHVSQHIGEVAGQLSESLANLEALLAEGSKQSGRNFYLSDCEALRVYLRKPEDLAVAESMITAAGIDRQRVLYLHGDICRRELDVELEGVFVAA
ncbi:MAG: pteridine-dependent deoxygenase [Arenimonas sp.]